MSSTGVRLRLSLELTHLLRWRSILGDWNKKQKHAEGLEVKMAGAEARAAGPQHSTATTGTTALTCPREATTPLSLVQPWRQ